MDVHTKMHPILYTMKRLKHDKETYIYTLYTQETCVSDYCMVIVKTTSNAYYYNNKNTLPFYINSNCINFVQTYCILHVQMYFYNKYI